MKITINNGRISALLELWRVKERTTPPTTIATTTRTRKRRRGFINVGSSDQNPMCSQFTIEIDDVTVNSVTTATVHRHHQSNHNHNPPLSDPIISWSTTTPQLTFVAISFWPLTISSRQSHSMNPKPYHQFQSSSQWPSCHHQPLVPSSSTLDPITINLMSRIILDHSLSNSGLPSILFWSSSSNYKTPPSSRGVLLISHCQRWSGQE